MSKPELSKWQNPEDGFPTGEYFDAVVVELEKIGIGVVESHRTEAHEFVLQLDPAAYRDGDLYWASEALWIGWRVNEESDPLKQGDDEFWYGLIGMAGSKPGWFWAAYTKQSALADVIHEVEDDDGNALPALEEPEVVAAAVAALVKPAE